MHHMMMTLTTELVLNKMKLDLAVVLYYHAIYNLVSLESGLKSHLGCVFENYNIAPMISLHSCTVFCITAQDSDPKTNGCEWAVMAHKKRLNSLQPTMHCF